MRRYLIQPWPGSSSSFARPLNRAYLLIKSGTGQHGRPHKLPAPGKSNRQPGEPALPRIPWSMTIADVASQYQDAASYCALVTEWARATLKEMHTGG